MIRRLFFLFAIALLTMANLHAQTPNTPIPTQAAPEKEASPATAPKTLNIPDDTPKEDWNTLALAKSNLPLQSIGGFLLSKVDLPGGCTREMLRMEWRKNDPIDLYLIRPTQSRAGRYSLIETGFGASPAATHRLCQSSATKLR